MFEPTALVSIGLPLFLVTMAAQNVPGMAVLAQFGYRPPLRPILTATGLATVAGAPFGGHAVNLAAISAALAAGPDADPDPGRRWIASITTGLGLGVLGLGAGLATAVLLLSPRYWSRPSPGSRCSGRWPPRSLQRSPTRTAARPPPSPSS
nr:benzoate/H(+) symporter BenE family transporter [Pseudonocardia nigra]